MRRPGDGLMFKRGGGVGTHHRHQLKQLGGGVKGLFGRLSIAVIVLVICTVSLLSTIKSSGNQPVSRSEVSF
ncbi:hypothetical protein Acr_08g0014680 [Actinidia rufa]|uniref:Uncharacterized protein n=1 Tax=Actinidia rufa TaxID=165716 RepID=A0A7J0F307_9ERIC|nr:hypothetical protein Acr_08g0014680 [Actinidia rufa]